MSKCPRVAQGWGGGWAPLELIDTQWIQDSSKLNTVWEWENVKYLDRIFDLTPPQEAGLLKMWTWEVGLFFTCLSGLWKIMMTQMNVVTKVNQPGEN